MQNGKYKVALKDMISKMELENQTPDVPVDNTFLTQTEVNRPAL